MQTSFPFRQTESPPAASPPPTEDVPPQPPPEATPEPPPAVRLGVELEAALLRELRATYHDLNARFFKKKLSAAALELVDTRATLGCWRSDVHTIEIARLLALEHPWGTVVEVLKHEMAHQFVHEVLGKTDETAHGPAFRDVCTRLGIDASATGVPDAGARSAGGESPDAHLLARIAKLLALAESPNEHEAQAAMSAAQRLMLKHNLDRIKDTVPRGYSFRQLGTPTGRVNEHERLLGAILGKHFFVEVIWVPVYRPLEGKQGSVLEASGTIENLEMATYVHAFLMHTAEHLWEAHKKSTNIDKNRDRRTFLAGVMTGFLEKLNRERTAHKEAGLVWVGDGDLEAFYRRRHPNIVHIRHQGFRRTEAHEKGRQAGRNIVLHKPVGGGQESRGRLLPPKS